MGKRSNFERKSRDFYATIDPIAVEVLAPYVNGLSFIEPCAGNGKLAQDLIEKANCVNVGMCDIEPGLPSIARKSCLELEIQDTYGASVFITNPPFSWPMLQPILDHLPTLLPTWLLLPADNLHNKRMGKYMAKCDLVVSVGRLYWMDNKIKGVDNYCWYRFTDMPQQTIFIGRT